MIFPDIPIKTIIIPSFYNMFPTKIPWLSCRFSQYIPLNIPSWFKSFSHTFPIDSHGFPHGFPMVFQLFCFRKCMPWTKLRGDELGGSSICHLSSDAAAELAVPAARRGGEKRRMSGFQLCHGRAVGKWWRISDFRWWCPISSIESWISRENFGDLKNHMQ